MCLMIEIHGKPRVFQFWRDEFCQLKQRGWCVVGGTLALKKAKASPGKQNGWEWG